MEALNIDNSKWQKVKLSELADDISEREDNPSKSVHERFVGLNHFVSGELKIKQWAITDNLVSSAKVFKTGDILFARRNAYLRRASMVDFDGLCSGDAFVLRENHKKIVPGFLTFILNSDKLWDYANANAAGTMSKRVKWRDLGNYKFLLPPKDQQAKLAELLWTADGVVEKYGSILKTLGIQKDAIIKIKLKEYQDNFENGPLKSIAKLIGGCAFKSTEFTSEQNVRTKQVLKIANLTITGINLNKVPSFLEGNRHDERYLLKSDDIAISLTGSHGKRDYGFAVINESNETYWINQRLAIIRADKKRALPKYIYYLMKEDIFLDAFFINAIGTANQANVSMKMVENIELPIPSLIAQKEFVTLIDRIQKNKKDTEILMANASSIQKQLINQIFS